MLVHPFIPYLLFVLAMYATPGPATLSTAACGASFGFRRSIPYIMGIITGILIIFILVALGLGILFLRYPTMHSIFKWISLFYIFYLAYKIAKAPVIVTNTTKRLGYLDGIPLALLNPKAYFAVLATFSQFIEQDDFYSSLVRLIIWTIGLTILIDFSWCLAGHWLGKILATSRVSSYVNIGFAILLVGSVIYAAFI